MGESTMVKLVAVLVLAVLPVSVVGVVGFLLGVSMVELRRGRAPKSP